MLKDGKPLSDGSFDIAYKGHTYTITPDDVATQLGTDNHHVTKTVLKKIETELSAHIESRPKRADPHEQIVEEGIRHCVENNMRNKIS